GSFFYIFNNDSLEFVNAPNFEKVDSVSISNNPQLKKLNLCNLVVDETFDVANNHPSINQGPPYCYNQPEETENEDSDDATTEVDDSLEIENEENEPDTESNEENTSVYPNPSDTEIHIDVDREIVGIHILDFTGNLVKAFTNSQNSYDVSDIASGIYYMVVYYIDGTSYSKKIIIR
ncbi:MAG: T9SS type A sorting domain-containing protein, partial [Bacteroidota bacterium]